MYQIDRLIKIVESNIFYIQVIQDHIAEHVYSNGKKCRFICRACGNDYIKSYSAKQHYRNCENMDKKRYPNWQDGIVDKMIVSFEYSLTTTFPHKITGFVISYSPFQDCPFESVMEVVREIFNDERFITKLPKTIRYVCNFF